ARLTHSPQPNHFTHSKQRTTFQVFLFTTLIIKISNKASTLFIHHTRFSNTKFANLHCNPS
ncbi:hypothetical protein CROQUDRAFT_724556, partial [Cronartium quercuum f. sp. fusiforme G11]